jgi:uncharacterized protein
MKRPPILYLLFFSIVMLSWFWFTKNLDLGALYKTNWMAPLTMVFGSFIAGASSEGGGAVAYPVFTLLMHVPSHTAMNFSFACQSIGMTAASLIIIGLKIPVLWRAIFYVSLSGALGLILSTFYLSPLLPGPETKIFFVSLWLSFGFALYLSNRNAKREVLNDFDSFTSADKIKIIAFGFIGGGITAFFGNGIDIFTFCLFTLYYKINEKIATPTSVIIMTINTILGFGLHFFVLKDVEPQAIDFWLVSIPIVIVFAPLGAYFVNLVSRKTVVNLLLVIIVVQYFGAFWVLQPQLYLVLVSVGVLGVGSLFFWKIPKR